MAKNNEPEMAEKKAVSRYKGFQLLRMEKYSNLIAKVVIKADKEYSFEEADKLIAEFRNRKDA